MDRQEVRHFRTPWGGRVLGVGGAIPPPENGHLKENGAPMGRAVLQAGWKKVLAGKPI